MIFLLNCAIKVSVILLATLGAARILRGRSAALRHCVLAAGMLSAAITPSLSVVIPGWTWNVMIDAPAPIPAAAYSGLEENAPANRPFIPVPLPRKTEQLTQTQAAPVTPAQRTESRWSSYALSTPDTLALIWIAGFAVGLAVLLFGYAHLMWITRGSHPLNSEVWTCVAAQIAREYRLPQPPRLLQNGDFSVLFTWGWRQPRILVPEGAPSWPIDRIQAVLCHELAHARRGDWVVQMTAELVRAVYWFNPLVWVVCRSLRRESEHACDDAALNSGITGSDYAGHVLDVVRSLRHPRRTWSYALSMAGPSTLEKRFVAMLNPSADRQTLTRLSLAAILVAFVALTLPLSMLRGATAPAEPALALPAIVAEPVPPSALQGPSSLTGEQAVGGVQGIVRRAGSGEPVPNVEVALDGGPADPKSVEALVRGVAGRGIVFTPKRIGTVDEVVQDVTDVAGLMGVGPGFPIFQDAVRAFRMANAARFVALTDRDGRFAIRNVPAGEYKIHPEREGLFDPAGGNFMKVNVAGNQISDLVIPMLAGGVMTGRVVDAAGRPVQDANVDALMMTYENGYPVFRPVVTKQTDDQGDYRLFWLMPGEYFVQASVPPVPGSANPLVRTLYPSTPDVASATPLIVRGDDKLTGLDIQLRNDRLARLTGLVTTTIPSEETAKQAQLYSQALARPTIMLVSRDTNKPDVTGGGARVVGTVVLDGGKGQFQTTGILPGTYDLFARIPESNADGGAGFAFGRTTVDVGNEDIRGLSIAVHPSVNVKGTVTINGRPPQQTPVRVTLRADGGSMKLGIYQTLSQRFVMPEANGSFTIIGVPPGLYRAEIGAGLPSDVYVADVRYGARSAFDSGFEVTSETPDPVQVVLSSGAGTVEGVVQDSTGKFLPNVDVVLAPAEARRQNRALYHTAKSDAAGKFSFHNVAPASYKLFSWRQNIPADAWYNSGFMGRYESSGRPVNVTQGATVTQQITAIP